MGAGGLGRQADRVVHQNGGVGPSVMLVNWSFRARPINHLGSACFVSFPPVLGFIRCALKSNTAERTAAARTRPETKLALTNATRVRACVRLVGDRILVDRMIDGVVVFCFISLR